MRVALEADYFCVGPQDRSRSVFNATNQISRHAARQPPGPDKQVDAFGGLREKDGGLAGRISAAHDYHFFTNAQLRLHEGRGVVHPRAFKLRQVFERRFPILGARSR